MSWPSDRIAGPSPVNGTSTASSAQLCGNGDEVLHSESQVSGWKFWPSSHCSPVSMTPSPHLAGRQLVRQALGTVFELEGPLSHCSPAPRFKNPSPHWGRVQSASQPSSEIPRLSHASPVSTTPSPQLAALQLVRQASTP